jgi:hypothetical protein
MNDRWFPRLSPDGRHIASGNLLVAVHGAIGEPPLFTPGAGHGPVWLDDSSVVYATEGGVMRAGFALPAMLIHLVQANALAGGGRRWAAYTTVPSPRIVEIDRVHLGFSEAACSPSGGRLLLVRHENGSLWLGGMLLSPHPCRGVRWTYGGATWTDAVVQYHERAMWWSGVEGEEPVDVSVSDKCFAVAACATPVGPWIVVLDDAGPTPRYVARPVETTLGYDLRGEWLETADAAWDVERRCVRLVGTDNRGRTAVLGEVTVTLDAPRLELRRVAPAWASPGTPADVLAFMAPTYDGTLRDEVTGQTLQSVRTGPHEITVIKGEAARIEVFRWDVSTVWMVFDATDGRAQPYRIEPGVFARLDWRVGDLAAFPTATLVRRQADGTGRRERFPYAVRCLALGEHIDLGGDLGACRVLITTWEPGYPVSSYQEHHWWAVRESDGLPLGRVRYEEYQDGQPLPGRAFTFNRLEDTRLAPAAPLPIPDPAETRPPTMPIITIAPPPRDHELAVITDLRDQYPTRVGHPLNDEGIAAWALDTYAIGGRLRLGLSHEAALERMWAHVDAAVAEVPPPPDPR